MHEKKTSAKKSRNICQNAFFRCLDVSLDLGMFTFYFFKRSFPYENDDEKSIVFLKVRFLKNVVFRTIVLKNDSFQNNRFYKNRRFVNDRKRRPLVNDRQRRLFVNDR